MTRLLAFVFAASLAQAQFFPFPGPGRSPSGGGATSIEFLGSAANFAPGSGNTLTSGVMGSVSTGNGIICVVSGQSAETVTVTDNSSTALTLQITQSRASFRWTWFTLASSPAGGRTFTATWSSATTHRAILCYRIAYSGGALTLDQGNHIWSDGVTDAITTGTITTTAGGLSIAAWVGADFGGSTPTGRQINSTVSVSVDELGSIHTWYNNFPSPYTSGQGTGTAYTSWWNSSITHWRIAP